VGGPVLIDGGRSDRDTGIGDTTRGGQAAVGRRQCVGKVGRYGWAGRTRAAIVDQRCPPGIRLGGDAESGWDTVARCQAAEVRCLCTGPIDVVTVGMAKLEDLRGESASFAALAVVEPRGIACQRA
jgi:hypothetical protein